MKQKKYCIPDAYILDDDKVSHPRRLKDHILTYFSIDFYSSPCFYINFFVNREGVHKGKYEKKRKHYNAVKCNQWDMKNLLLILLSGFLLIGL